MGSSSIIFTVTYKFECTTESLFNGYTFVDLNSQSPYHLMQLNVNSITQSDRTLVKKAFQDGYRPLRWPPLDVSMGVYLLGWVSQVPCPWGEGWVYIPTPSPDIRPPKGTWDQAHPNSPEGTRA